MMSKLFLTGKCMSIPLKCTDTGADGLNIASARICLEFAILHSSHVLHGVLTAPEHDAGTLAADLYWMCGTMAAASSQQEWMWQRCCCRGVTLF